MSCAHCLNEGAPQLTNGTSTYISLTRILSHGQSHLSIKKAGKYNLYSGWPYAQIKKNHMFYRRQTQYILEDNQ